MSELNDLYYVVMNHEEQYSIWNSKKEIPGGWVSVGEPMSKDACLDYIENHWTDMRPLSLRNS
ncbi:MbtH family protein [Teredinibacter turnerae]|uniref:MbtH family protein n=1 Tax=Teredinibacter turnerae TaxID=2426 RepID=UPI00048FDDB8|nr:MbtH family NRPS accessory protein [Teredinibacter turnerae]